jgi:hypothetical protein
MLILPGGHSWDTGANSSALELASQFIASGTPVAATCAATLALARAGLLDHLRLTGTAREYLISSGHRGAGFYCGIPARVDPDSIAPPGFAPIDYAREIFKMLNVTSNAPLDAWYPMPMHADASKYSALARN